MTFAVETLLVFTHVVIVLVFDSQRETGILSR